MTQTVAAFAAGNTLASKFTVKYILTVIGWVFVGLCATFDAYAVTMALLTHKEHIIAWGVNFITTHKQWAPGIVFVLAFAESVAIVSLIAPAIAILFLGSLALGAIGLEWYEVILIFSGGAFGGYLGYDISFRAGKHFGASLVRVWPLRNHARRIADAQEYFERSKDGWWPSVAVASSHFLGPLRGFLPLVAGMAHMPPRQFNSGNLAGALLWAFAIPVAPGLSVMLGLPWLQQLIKLLH